MPASRPDNHEQLPPLAAEDYTCDICALIYSEITIDDALGVIAGLPGTVREVVSAIPPEACRAQGRQACAVAEYLCHLRDVYISYTIRLHRIRAEDRPALEPMFNDLRARRFRYNHCDINATLDELSAAVAGFCEQIAGTEESGLGPHRDAFARRGSHRTLAGPSSVARRCPSPRRHPENRRHQRVVGSELSAVDQEFGSEQVFT